MGSHLVHSVLPYDITKNSLLLQDPTESSLDHPSSPKKDINQVLLGGIVKDILQFFFSWIIYKTFSCNISFIPYDFAVAGGKLNISPEAQV